ncbi:Uncharacterised protein [Turicibacter sanguinis]|nr:hypothetical protein [Turicibacter sp.]CUN76778.1 Uncharacterised protein [Turicibacter sanguinis]CUQ01988.1 Uncharacterised protein [Turicibacter sanguinis]
MKKDKMFRRRVAVRTLLKPKFLISALIIQIISANLMKLIINELPEFNKVITDLIIYGPQAILIIYLAVLWDMKNDISSK